MPLSSFPGLVFVLHRRGVPIKQDTQQFGIAGRIKLPDKYVERPNLLSHVGLGDEPRGATWPERLLVGTPRP